MNQNDILVSIDYQIEEATAAARAEAIAEGRSEGLKIGIEEGRAKTNFGSLIQDSNSNSAGCERKHNRRCLLDRIRMGGGVYLFSWIR